MKDDSELFNIIALCDIIKFGIGAGIVAFARKLKNEEVAGSGWESLRYKEKQLLERGEQA